MRSSAIWGGCREPVPRSATRGCRSIGAAGIVGGPAEAVRHIPSIQAVILRVSWMMATFSPTMPDCSTICSVPRGRYIHDYPYNYDQFGGSRVPSTASAFQRPTSELLGVGGFGSEHPAERSFAGRRGGQLFERDDQSNPLHADGESRRFQHGRLGRPWTLALAFRDFSRGVVFVPIQLFSLRSRPTNRPDIPD